MKEDKGDIDDMEFIKRLIERRGFSCFFGNKGKDFCMTKDGFTHCVPKENILKLTDEIPYLDVVGLVTGIFYGVKKREETKNIPLPPVTKEEAKKNAEKNMKKFMDWLDQCAKNSEDQSFKNN